MQGYMKFYEHTSLLSFSQIAFLHLICISHTLRGVYITELCLKITEYKFVPCISCLSENKYSFSQKSI